MRLLADPVPEGRLEAAVMDVLGGTLERLARHLRGPIVIGECRLASEVAQRSGAGAVAVSSASIGSQA